jgi:hypothetical protein
MFEQDLVTRMIGLMGEVLEVICSIAGFDFIEMQIFGFWHSRNPSESRKISSET